MKTEGWDCRFTLTNTAEILFRGKCSLRIFGIRASLLAILSSNSKSFYLLESGYELYLSSSDLHLTSVTLSPETKCTLSSDWCLNSGGDPGFRKLFSFALQFGSSFNWRVSVNNFIKLLIHTNYSVCNYPIQSTSERSLLKRLVSFVDVVMQNFEN